LEFGDVGFCGGRKSGEPGEKPSAQGESQRQTEPAYGTRLKSNLGLLDYCRLYFLKAYLTFKLENYG